MSSYGASTSQVSLPKVPPPKEMGPGPFSPSIKLEKIPNLTSPDYYLVWAESAEYIFLIFHCFDIFNRTETHLIDIEQAMLHYAETNPFQHIFFR